MVSEPNENKRNNDKEKSPYAIALIIFMGALMFIIVMFTVGELWYKSIEFEAEVVSIEYYGRSAGFTGGVDKANITFSNGMVLNLYENKFPLGLQRGIEYQFQVRIPYIAGSPRLIVIK